MRHQRIEHWDDERSLGNSLIVTLKRGWAFVPSRDERIAQHVDGFDTIKAAMIAIKKSKPCGCAYCNGERE